MRLMDTPALNVSHITKEYRDFKLDDVSFVLPQGSVVGIIGENGAGKSTTLKAIMDLIELESGEISFYGKKMNEAEREIKESVGVVFDNMGFYEQITPKRAGIICKHAYRSWNQTTYEQYLKKFQLPEKKTLKSFSRGMRSKFSLAVALSHNSKILILDEPTNGLDPVMRADILDVFLDFMQDETHSILISSHITSDLEKIADYITFIHNGQIEFSEVKDRLIYEYGIMRCSFSDFSQIDRTDILTAVDRGNQMDVLVKSRKAAQEKYRDIVTDAATLDEIMRMVIKGSKYK